MKIVRNTILSIIFVTILICIATFFIRINDINVVNNEYVNEEIIKDNILRPERNDSLFFILTKNIIKKGRYDIPHVEKIDLSLGKDFKILATVKEKPILAYVKKVDMLYYFDEDLYIVKKSNEREDDKIEVVGLSSIDVDVGGYLIQNKTNINLLFIVKTINNMLTRNGLLIDVIEVTKPENIELMKDNISVNIGNGAYLEEKLDLFLMMYEKICDKTGILDLSIVNTKDDKGEYIFKQK